MVTSRGGGLFILSLEFRHHASAHQDAGVASAEFYSYIW